MPRERLAALADDGTYTEHDARAPSPHLARYGIAAQDDDGVVAASLCIHGRAVEVVAQDARFLGGSVGERHAQKISAAISRARASRRPLLVLAASGGVRLHEANAAEIALARVLRALVDARAAGIATLAIGVGDVFGGMSIVAAACDALALTPSARCGLSGPRVIALARAGTLDATDRSATDALFGAAARVRARYAEAVDDNATAMRDWIGGWIGHRLAAPVAFDAAIRQAQLRYATALEGAHVAQTVTASGERAKLHAFVREVDAVSLAATDAELLALSPSVRTLLIVEDSRGHAASVEAEHDGLSWRLAQHACVLGVLRARGVAIVGVVDGIGHSAAFFANALQADRLYALPGARIVAMEPQAIARVTGMDGSLLARAIDDDPLLGHLARHFAALGGLAMISAMDEAR